MANDQRWLSKQEAADRLGCSAKTIDRLRAAGELCTMKRGKTTQARVRIETASLKAYEKRQLEKAKPRPARDEIEARFPIPELDALREAKAEAREEAARQKAEAARTASGEAT